MISLTYPSFLEKVFDSSIGSGSTFKAILVNNTYAFNSAHQSYSDVSTFEISGSGYVSGGNEVTVSSSVDTQNFRTKFSFSNVGWNNSSLSCYGCIIYADSGTPSTSYLVKYINFLDEKTSSANVLGVDIDDLFVGLKPKENVNSLGYDRFGDVLDIFSSQKSGNFFAGSRVEYEATGSLFSNKVMMFKSGVLDKSSFDNNLSSVSLVKDLRADEEIFLFKNNSSQQIFDAKNKSYVSMVSSSLGEIYDADYLGDNNYLLATSDQSIMTGTYVYSSGSEIELKTVFRYTSSDIKFASDDNYIYTYSPSIGLQKSSIPLANGFAVFDASNNEEPIVPISITGGEILGIVPDGTGGYFVFGSFTGLSGINADTDVYQSFSINRLCRLDSQFRVYPTWNPAPNNTVYDAKIDSTGNYLYIVGSFSNDFVWALYFARVIISTGIFDTSLSIQSAGSTYRPLSAVLSIQLDETDGDGYIYLGGEFPSFTRVSGSGPSSLSLTRLVRLSVNSLSSIAEIDVLWSLSITNGGVYSLELDKQNGFLYFSGNFTNPSSYLKRVYISGENDGTIDVSWSPSVLRTFSTGKSIFLEQDYVWYIGYASNPSSGYLYRISKTNSSINDSSLYRSTRGAYYNIEPIISGSVQYIGLAGTFSKHYFDAGFELTYNSCGFVLLDPSGSYSHKYGNIGFVEIPASSNSQFSGNARCSYYNPSTNKILVGGKSSSTLIYGEKIDPDSSGNIDYNICRFNKQTHEIDPSWGLYVKFRTVPRGFKIFGNYLYIWGNLSETSVRGGNNFPTNYSTYDAFRVNLTNLAVEPFPLNQSAQNTNYGVHDIDIHNGFIYLAGMFDVTGVGTKNVARFRLDDLSYDSSFNVTGYVTNNYPTRICVGVKESDYEPYNYGQDVVYVLGSGVTSSGTITSATGSISPNWVKLYSSETKG